MKHDDMRQSEVVNNAEGVGRFEATVRHDVSGTTAIEG